MCHPHHQNFPCRFGAGHGGSAGSKAAGAAQPGTARCTAAGTLPEPEPPANLPKPKASILDDDIPDFSAGLDPAALEAARKADEKAPPRSTDEFQRAASQLFEDDEDDGEDDGEDEEPTVTFPGRSKAKPAVPRPLAAKQEPKQDAIHNRSLAMIERAERRHRRKAIAAVAVIALLVLVGAAVLLGLTRGCTVKAPAYKKITAQSSLIPRRRHI